MRWKSVSRLIRFCGCAQNGCGGDLLAALTASWHRALEWISGWRPTKAINFWANYVFYFIIPLALALEITRQPGKLVRSSGWLFVLHTVDHCWAQLRRSLAGSSTRMNGRAAANGIGQLIIDCEQRGNPSGRWRKLVSSSCGAIARLKSFRRLDRPLLARAAGQIYHPSPSNGAQTRTEASRKSWRPLAIGQPSLASGQFSVHSAHWQRPQPGSEAHTGATQVNNILQTRPSAMCDKIH